MTINPTVEAVTGQVCAQCGHGTLVETAFVLSSRCCTAVRAIDGSLNVEYLDTPEVKGSATIVCANCHTELDAPDDLVAAGTPPRRPEWRDEPPTDDSLAAGAFEMFQEIRRCDPERFDRFIDRVRSVP